MKRANLLKSPSTHYTVKFRMEPGYLPKDDRKCHAEDYISASEVAEFTAAGFVPRGCLDFTVTTPHGAVFLYNADGTLIR